MSDPTSEISRDAIRFVAVIDLGKTNYKLALVDTKNAKELQIDTRAASTIQTGLYPAIDHDAIEAFIIERFRQLYSEHQIDAITVTTHGATVALVDASGQLALPVLDYECTLPDELNEEYERLRPPFADSGSPRLPCGLNIGAQLYWQQHKFPEAFAKVTTLLTWPQYWVYRLTGKKYNDVTSLGCHSDLYTPQKKCFSTLVHMMHWDRLMPPNRNSGEFVGHVEKSMAKQLGLTQAIPVYAGIHDSNASLVPYLAKNDGPFTVISTGTWFISMAIGAEKKPLDESRDTLLNVNAFGDSVPSARFMGGREREIVTEGKIHRRSDDLQQLLETNSALALQLMPSAVPGTGPYPETQSKWINSTAANENLQSCATALYLALMTHECMKLIGSRGATYLEGPLTHDIDFMAMLRSVTERELYSSASSTGTSVGAAMLISKPESSDTPAATTVEPETQTLLTNYAKQWTVNLQAHVARHT